MDKGSELIFIIKDYGGGNFLKTDFFCVFPEGCGVSLCGGFVCDFVV